MLRKVLKIAEIAVVAINWSINLNTHTHTHTQKHTMWSLIILVLYMLVIRYYQRAWRAILTNTNRRWAQEMALEGLLDWVVLHSKYSISVFMYIISSYVHTQYQLKFKLHYLGYIFFIHFVSLSKHYWSCTKTCLLFTPNNFLLKFK
jgi:hypothetical protein